MDVIAWVHYCKDLIIVKQPFMIEKFYEEGVSRASILETDLYGNDFVIFPIYKE